MTGTRTVCRTVMDTVEQQDGKQVNVPRQVQEQVPYTYSVTKSRAEGRRFSNCSVLVAQNGRLMRIAERRHLPPVGTKVFVVKSEEDAMEVFQRMTQATTELSDVVESEGMKWLNGTFLVTEAPSSARATQSQGHADNRAPAVRRADLNTPAAPAPAYGRYPPPRPHGSTRLPSARSC